MELFSDIVCCVTVRATCADHVHAAEVPARLHVPASRPIEACSPLHCHPDHLSHWTMDDQNHQTDLNHISSHGSSPPACTVVKIK